MKYTVSSPAVILILLMMMHLAAGRSLPTKRENWIVTTHRDANVESSSNDNDNMVSEIAELQTQLANLSIPSYLKDLYVNLTYPNGEARSSSNNEEIKVNTILSYKNNAKSM